MKLRMSLAAAVSAAVLCLLCTLPAAGGEESGDKPEVQNPEVPRITAQEARKLFNDGKLLLVNTQERNGQEKSMLLGAIGAPSGLINGAELRIPENLIVAFYCM